MTVTTLRDKNQITLPAKLLAKHGFRRVDRLEFEDLPDGGIVVRRSDAAPRPNAYEVFRAIADAVPGLEQVDWEPDRDTSPMRIADL